MKRSFLALLLTVAATPAARAAVADEFVCHVAYTDAQGNVQLATKANLAVVREPVAQTAGYDMSTAGEADLHATAPQVQANLSLTLNYRHDLRLSDRNVVSAVQTTCLTGTLTDASGQARTISSDGCNGNGTEVSVVEGAPAFEGNLLTAVGDVPGGQVDAACRHVRSILH